MKKTALAIAVAATQLTGCQITPTTEATFDIGETNYTARLEENQVVSEFRFESIDQRIIEIKQQAVNNLWSEDKLTKNIDAEKNMRGAGTFIVTGYDTTIGAASHGYICAMLVQNNKKVEESCMDDVANIPSGHGYTKDMWWNVTVLYTSELDTTKPFELRVNSSLLNTMTRYTFEPTAAANITN